MGSALLPTLRLKREVDAAIRDTLDKVLVLRFGRAADASCLHLDDIVILGFLMSSMWNINELCKARTPDHTKWIGSFSSKQDFIDVVELFASSFMKRMFTGIICLIPSISCWQAIFRGAMKGKLIVPCPLPPERIPKFQLLFKDV
ncbi:hypothetical protein BAE44_0002295 [Dichanthelium oligosanthes]|uniref:Uncharacterized protein n=1 Tax=Dichanthelium oligosanthes TaxID=888268 RepID=A0A1E5WH13_9POAL|nr:hypothetical protein BAE44_0002295 [Dichanthelium oligosanthes]